MSTDLDMYAERENILILEENTMKPVHYDSLKVGRYYLIPLLNGKFSIYKKTNLYDDELIEKVNTLEEAIQKFLSDPNKYE